MKSIFTAAVLLGATVSAFEAEMINHDFKHFSVHFTPKSKAMAMIGSRTKSHTRSHTRLRSSSVKSNTGIGGEVSGYKVEWFQYISVTESEYSENITQFGTWYKDDVTNDTRTEVVTYSLFNAGNGDRYYVTPSEYLDINGNEYQILEADSQYVYCETTTPFPEEDLEWEELGYAFIIPPEEAFSIIWGPRLVRVYMDPTTNEETVAYYGNDAFNGEPVITVQYNTTYEQSFVWSKIRQEDLESTEFAIPTDLTCSDTSTMDSDDGSATSITKPWYDEEALRILRSTPWN